MTLAESLFRHLVCMCLLYFQYDDTYGMHKKKNVSVCSDCVCLCAEFYRALLYSKGAVVTIFGSATPVTGSMDFLLLIVCVTNVPAKVYSAGFCSPVLLIQNVAFCICTSCVAHIETSCLPVSLVTYTWAQAVLLKSHLSCKHRHTRTKLARMLEMAADIKKRSTS